MRCALGGRWELRATAVQSIRGVRALLGREVRREGPSLNGVSPTNRPTETERQTCVGGKEDSLGHTVFQRAGGL